MDRCRSGHPEAPLDVEDARHRAAARCEPSARVVLVTASGSTVDITQAAAALLDHARATTSPALQCADGTIAWSAACPPSWAPLCRHLGRCGGAPCLRRDPAASARAAPFAECPAPPTRARIAVTLASVRPQAHALLHRQLAAEPDIDCRAVCAAASDWAAAPDPAPDVLVIDSSWCKPPSLHAIAAIGARVPKLRVVLAGDNPAAHALTDTIARHWLHGLLPAHCPATVRVKAIRAVVRGELWLPRALLEQLAADRGGTTAGATLTELDATPADGALTDRQSQIVAHLRQGFTNKEIARRLGIQEDTVKKHLQAVFGKLGVRRRALVALGNGTQRWPDAA